LKDIHFEFDRYDIRPAEARVLEEHARWLKANVAYLVLIEGHTDDRGTNEYNMALADRRAKATLNYLVAHGVHERRISTITYGEKRPGCKAKTEDCWARNRRPLPGEVRLAVLPLHQRCGHRAPRFGGEADS
jgi:peptidoglycan-associated lipoprotein